MDLSAFYYVARYETRRERMEMKHASEIFPQALKQLIEIGEKAREQRERAKHGALPRETGACKHVAREEKQAKQLQLQLK